jgi:hypothetical protein
MRGLIIDVRLCDAVIFSNLQRWEPPGAESFLLDLTTGILPD